MWCASPSRRVTPNAPSSLAVLMQMRRALVLSDDEHRQLLEEAGVEDLSLLDPNTAKAWRIRSGSPAAASLWNG